MSSNDDNSTVKGHSDEIAANEAEDIGNSENDSNKINSTEDMEPASMDQIDNGVEDSSNKGRVSDSESMNIDQNETLSTEPLIEEPHHERMTKFPIGRIKHIMKMDPDVKMASTEATFLITNSLELFVESLAWEAHRYTEQSRKKTVAKADVERAIDGVEALAFLDGAMDD